MRRRQEARYEQQQAAQQQAPAQVPAPAPAAGGDETSELERLAQLHNQGLLTDEEFSAAKAKLLGI